MANMAAKRPRTPSSSSSLLATSDASPPDPPPKAFRIHPSESDATSTPSSQSQAVGHPILCNLPPTCHHKPTPIPNTNELERHYALYHAHVCGVEGCGNVFPEARLLDLHQTECHDPIAALRKERNEKIFQCHIPAPACGRNFLTPKARRLHLIQVHNYPKQYFFAVTNKGIGGLLKRWGEGASLIRKEWKPRESQGKVGTKNQDDVKMDEDEGDDEGDKGQPTTTDEDDEAEPADLDATPRIRPRKILSPTTSHSSRGSEAHHNRHRHDTQQANTDIAGLTQSLNALSLVPSSVRFGRGNKAKGFAPDSSFRGGTHGVGRGNHTTGSTTTTRPLDVDGRSSSGPSLHVKRGVPFRGRGRPRARGRP